MLVSVVLGYSQATGAAGRPGGRWRGREARRPMARHYRAKTTGVRQWSRMPSRAPRWRAATGKGAAARVGSPDGRASRPTATGLYGDGVRPRCAAMGRNGGRARCPYRAARVMRGCTGDGVAQRGTATGPHGDGAWRGNGHGDARFVSICHNTRGGGYSPFTRNISIGCS